MSQHSNLVLQEDLVSWGMIFNIFETEMSFFFFFFSMKGLCLFSFPWWNHGVGRESVLAGEGGGSVPRTGRKASDFCPPWRCGGWGITVCSGAVQLSNKGKRRHWGNISYSRTRTFYRAYCRWVMGRVLGLQPGDPTVTICVTFTHLCNPCEIQFAHLWNADDTYWSGRRFRELMCVWSLKGICVL